jgi:hypothetical protein
VKVMRHRSATSTAKKFTQAVDRAPAPTFASESHQGVLVILVAMLLIAASAELSPLVPRCSSLPEDRASPRSPR